jgi:hypothetical protein
MASHASWDSGLAPWLCDEVDALVAAAKYWHDKDNNKIGYNPYAALTYGGPNSNGAARYFGEVVGHLDVNPPLTAYGWRSYIPFPN